MVLVGVYALCLVVGTLGFLVSEVYSPGTVYTAPAPACVGCYCTASDPLAEVNVTSDVAYGLHKDLVLDIYTAVQNGSSSSSAVPGGRPAVVLMHGGGFFKGSKTDLSIVQEVREHRPVRGVGSASPSSADR